MKFAEERNHLRVEITSNGCDIPEDERARLQTLLAPLEEAVQDYPGANLAIKINYHPNSSAHKVELKLTLPGRTLFASAENIYLDSALSSGLAALVRQVQAAPGQPDPQAVEASERRAALDRDVVAPEDPDAGPLAAAVEAGDYRRFRTSLAGYEEWLRKRVGRWVQRYPDAEARVGDGLLLGDLVEEVYLNAFERFTQRPTDVPLSQWLDGLLEPSLRALLRHPDREHENASLARTLRDAPLP